MTCSCNSEKDKLVLKALSIQIMYNLSEYSPAQISTFHPQQEICTSYHPH